MRCFIAIITVIACVAGCDTSTPSDKSALGGSTALQVTFLLGKEGAPQLVSIAQGHLTVPISIEVGTKFEGTWRLESTGAANVSDPLGSDFVAPLNGNGDLHGVRTLQECTVDLSPRRIDDNVVLIMPPSLQGEGEWQYVTYAGISASGIVKVSGEGGG